MFWVQQKTMANLTQSKRRYTEKTRFDELFFPSLSYPLCASVNSVLEFFKCAIKNYSSRRV
ncbi:MAG: hypothetical protein Ta2F_15710 [Termitinemataceae bacterium]|nr:MAG: hypothetical protein Ta2F_15710 [Termitinemataceae bacterium]